MYCKAEEELSALSPGSSIGSLLDECTRCPNPFIFGICEQCFKIEALGYHPEKGMIKMPINICAGNSKDKCIFGYGRKVTGKNKPLKEESPLDVWDRGELVFSKAEYNLIALTSNETLKGVLGGCTKCPVGNGSCAERFNIIVIAKAYGKREIVICSMAVESIDKCHLNK